jgi:hypothetical protein
LLDHHDVVIAVTTIESLAGLSRRVLALAVAEEAIVVGEAEAEDASVEKEEAVDGAEVAKPGKQRLPL